MIVEPIERTSGEGFQLMVQYGYDQYRNIYRIFVADDSWGVPDVYEGQIIENQLVLDNMRAETYVPLSDGRRLVVKLSIGLTEGSRETLMEASSDDGETWHRLYRQVWDLEL